MSQFEPGEDMNNGAVSVVSVVSVVSRATANLLSRPHLPTINHPF